LLPNVPENNLGPAETLDQYAQLKATVFQRTQKLLEQAGASQERLRWLQWLCRLESSVYGLGNDRGFGYEAIRDAWFARDEKEFTSAHRQALAHEEYRLMKVNQPQEDGKGHGTSIVQTAHSIDQIINSLLNADERRRYQLLRAGQESDAFTQAILMTMRKSQGAGLLEELKEEDVDDFWFMMTQCRSVLAQAAARGPENLKPEEKEAVVHVISSAMYLYVYFVPYIEGDFNVETLFGSQSERKGQLALFCMLNREIKRPMVDLLGQHGAKWDELAAGARQWGTLPPIGLKEIRTFLICHNLLPLRLLELSLDDVRRFQLLVDGWEVKMTAYNFRLLWVREDVGRVSLEALCEEVFDGVECNRDLLSESGVWSDDDRLQYYFGDMRRLLRQSAVAATGMPPNFDAVVRRFAALPEDSRLDRLKAQLEKRRGELADQAKDDAKRLELQRVETALRGVSTLRDRVNTVLAKGYEYFGRTLATQFTTPLAIQRACELAGDNIARAKPPALTAAAHQSYARFYESALFGPAGFRPELLGRIIAVFYTAPQKGETPERYRAAKRGEFMQLIAGNNAKRTRGLAATARKPVERRTRYEVEYLTAGKGALQSLFSGEAMKPGQPFLGDLIWEVDAKGIRTPKAIDYDNREEDAPALLLWIIEAARQYADVPEIRQLFVPQDLAVPARPGNEPPAVPPKPPRSGTGNSPASAPVSRAR